MTVPAGVDVETDVSLDLEVLLHEEVPCECVCNCGNTAKWRMILTCCNHQQNVCSTCRRRIRQHLLEQVRAGVRMRCSLCKTPDPDGKKVAWRPL